MAAPTITQQPIQGPASLVGVPVTLSVISPDATSYQWYKGSVLITGATSASYTISSPVESDSGAYYVACINVDGETDSNTVNVIIANSILDSIELQMAALIAGMTTSDGYNFNWSIVNEEDEAIGDFPRALIDPRDEMADQEMNMDTLAGIGSGDYTNEVLFTILVRGMIPSFSTNPSFAVRSTLRKALDDLKRLFGRHNQLDGTCDNILYQASRVEPIRTNEVLSAGQLRVKYKVVYSQDRFTPTLYASS